MGKLSIVYQQMSMITSSLDFVQFSIINQLLLAVSLGQPCGAAVMVLAQETRMEPEATLVGLLSETPASQDRES